MHHVFPALLSPASTPRDWILLPSFAGAVVNMTVAISVLIAINLMYVWARRLLKL